MGTVVSKPKRAYLFDRHISKQGNLRVINKETRECGGIPGFHVFQTFSNIGHNPLFVNIYFKNKAPPQAPMDCNVRFRKVP